MHVVCSEKSLQIDTLILLISLDYAVHYQNVQAVNNNLIYPFLPNCN